MTKIEIEHRAVSDKTEMLKALAAYSGPIKQCQPGGARGAVRWALHRAGGMSGVKPLINEEVSHDNG